MLSTGCRGLRRLCQNQIDNADAGAHWRKGLGEFLIAQGRLVADNVEGVIIKGSGHWLMDEARDQVVAKLVAFLGG